MRTHTNKVYFVSKKMFLMKQRAVDISLLQCYVVLGIHNIDVICVWMFIRGDIFSIFLGSRAFKMSSTKVWVIGNLLIVNRDLFFAIKIAIGDRHLIKRLPDDRNCEIQRSQSQKRDLFGDLGRHQYSYKFFKNLQKNARILHFENGQYYFWFCDFNWRW